MVRKTFGCDEVAEDDRCIFEVDIEFLYCVVEEIAISFYDEFVIIGIC